MTRFSWQCAFVLLAHVSMCKTISSDTAAFHLCALDGIRHEGVAPMAAGFGLLQETRSDGGSVEYDVYFYLRGYPEDSSLPRITILPENSHLAIQPNTASTSRFMHLVDGFAYAAFSSKPSSIEINTSSCVFDFSSAVQISTGLGLSGTTIDVVRSEVTNEFAGFALISLDMETNAIDMHFHQMGFPSSARVVLQDVSSKQSYGQALAANGRYSFGLLSDQFWTSVLQRQVQGLIVLDGSSLVFDINVMPSFVLSPAVPTLFEELDSDTVIATRKQTAPFVLHAARLPGLTISHPFYLDGYRVFQPKSAQYDYSITRELTVVIINPITTAYSESYTFLALVKDSNNHRPQIRDIQVHITENMPVGAFLGFIRVEDKDITFFDVSIELSCTAEVFEVQRKDYSSDGITEFILRVLHSIDRERTPFIACRVISSDTVGPGSDRFVNWTVSDVNDNTPMFNSCKIPLCELPSITVSESTPTGSIVAEFPFSDDDLGANGSVVASWDPQLSTLCSTASSLHFDLFINASKRVMSLIVKSALDYETMSKFTLCVRLRDRGTPQLSSAATLTVLIGNVGFENQINWLSQGIRLSQHPLFVSSKYITGLVTNNQEEFPSGENLAASRWSFGSTEPKRCNMSSWYQVNTCIAATGVPLKSRFGQPCRFHRLDPKGTSLQVRFVQELRDESGLGDDCPRYTLLTNERPKFKRIGDLFNVREAPCGLQLCDDINEDAQHFTPDVSDVPSDTVRLAIERLHISEWRPRNGFLRNDPNLDTWRDSNGQWVSNLSDANAYMQLSSPLSVHQMQMSFACVDPGSCVVSYERIIDGYNTLNVESRSDSQTKTTSFVVVRTPDNPRMVLEMLNFEISSNTLTFELRPRLISPQCTPCAGEKLCRPCWLPVLGLECYSQIDGDSPRLMTLDSESRLSKVAALVNGSHVYQISNVTEGYHNLYLFCQARVSSTVNGTLKYPFALDMSPPKIILYKWPKAPVLNVSSVNIVLAANEPLSRVVCIVDGILEDNCSRIDNYVLKMYSKFHFSHGNHSVQFSGIDLFGKSSPPVTLDLIIDIVPPMTQFVDFPSDLTHIVGSVTRTQTIKLNIVGNEPLSSTSCRMQIDNVLNQLNGCCNGLPEGCQVACRQGKLFSFSDLASLTSAVSDFAIGCFSGARDYVNAQALYSSCARNLSHSLLLSEINSPWSECTFPISNVRVVRGNGLVFEVQSSDLVGNKNKASRLQFLVDDQYLPRAVSTHYEKVASALQRSSNEQLCPKVSRNLFATTLLAGILFGCTCLGILITWYTYDTPAKVDTLSDADAIAPHAVDLNQKIALEQALELIHMSDMSAGLGANADYLEVQESTDYGLSSFRTPDEARNSITKSGSSSDELSDDSEHDV